MNNTPSIRRGNKKEQIVRTAEELFTRHESKRVTVEEICRQAHISKMTFYKHFANKVALVRHIRDVYVEEGFRKFDEIRAMAIPFARKIDCMTR